MSKIKFENGVTVDFDGDPTPQDVEEVANQLGINKIPQSDGFFKTLGKEMAKPFGEVYTAGANWVESAGKAIKGDWRGADQALDKERDLPFLGKTKPAFTGKESTLEAGKKMLGYGAEIGSYLPFTAGVGGVAKATLAGKIGQGALTGMAEGTLGGMLGQGGRALQENMPVQDVLGEAQTGAAFGGALGVGLGGLFPVGGALTKAASKPFQPVEVQVKTAIKDGILKGIKPYFTKIQSSSRLNKYLNQASQAIDAIYENMPTLANEEGIKEVRLPRNIGEFMDAVGQVKTSLYKKYNGLAQKAGETRLGFDVSDIITKADKISADLKFPPEIRNYAAQLKNELAELHGQMPEVIESRIADLNLSLGSFYEGRTSKAKAQVDASFANILRKNLDEQISKALDIAGGTYQGLKSQYAALKTIEKDVARRAMTELKKNSKGLMDLTDIFTGGDLLMGLVTGNPASFLKGAAGLGIKKMYKALNDPNRFIKNMFEKVNLFKRGELNQIKPPISKKNKLIIIDPDLIKKRFNDYDPKNHDKYSEMAKSEYDEALKTNTNPTLHITAGGAASGKSEFVVRGLENQGFDGVLLDNVMGNFESAKTKILKAFAAKKKVVIDAIVPNIERAWKYAQKRGMETGRFVPLETFVEGHIGVIETLKRVIKEFPQVKIVLNDTRAKTNEAGLRTVKTYKAKEKITKVLNSIKYDKQKLLSTLKDIKFIP